MTVEERTDLREFWDSLREVDWFYEMSDDPRAYRRGRESVERARARARELGPAGLELFDEFQAHYSVLGGNRPLPPRP